MRTKVYFYYAILGALFTLLCTHTNAQTIDIGPNQYAFRLTVNPNYGLFFNGSSQRYEFMNGSGSPVLGFDANNGNLTTDLRFASGSDYLVGNNRYAFRASSNPNYGLFFNASNLQYEFRNATATPVFTVNATNGKLKNNLAFDGPACLLVDNNEYVFKDASQNNRGLSMSSISMDIRDANGTARLSFFTENGTIISQGGLSVSGQAMFLSGINADGLIAAQGGNSNQWNAAHSWGNHASAGYLTTENDPKIGAINNNTLPRWNGSQLVSGSVNDNGSNVGIGALPAPNSKLTVSGSGIPNSPANSTIYAVRVGGSSNTGFSNSNWSASNQAAAISAFNSWGNSFTAAIQGTTYLDYSNAGAIVGSSIDDEVVGALVYRNFQGKNLSGYFRGGDVEIRSGKLNVVNFDQPSEILVEGIGNSSSANLRLFTSFFNIVNITHDWNIKATSGVLAFESRYANQNYATNFRITETNVTPGLNNTSALGSSALRWTTVFATNGTINTSDVRDKKNIEELRYGLDKVMELRPVSFQWNDLPDEGTKLGLIAQDLQKVLPEVVRDWDYEADENGHKHKIEARRLGVYYSDIIPVLIKAIQEQQSQIELLEPAKVEALEQELSEVKAHNERLQSSLDQVLERLADLERGLSSCCDGSKQGSSALPFSGNEDKAPWLGQNRPNPFNGSTVIDYFVPAHSNATLHISTISGQLVMQQRLDGQGNQVEISAGALAPGVYLYSLLMDGELMMSKRMVVQ